GQRRGHPVPLGDLHHDTGAAVCGARLARGVPEGARAGGARRDHHRDRGGRPVLLRRAVSPAVPRQEPGRLLRPRRHRGRLSERAGLSTGDASEMHPRPLLQRPGWTSLDGIWDFALDRDAKWRRPDEVAWDAQIRVPFAPETHASGIACEGEALAFWYRRRLAVPALGPGERFLVHFGAVDSEATVWIDGRL